MAQDQSLRQRRAAGRGAQRLRQDDTSWRDVPLRRRARRPPAAQRDVGLQPQGRRRGFDPADSLEKSLLVPGGGCYDAPLFMRFLVAFLLLAGPVFAVDSPPAEVRGLWVVRTALVTPQEVDRVVDQAAEGGFNALFVQIRGRGDAFYDSKLSPRSVL